VALAHRNGLHTLTEGLSLDTGEREATYFAHVLLQLEAF
jgi:hypothetical protein